MNKFKILALGLLFAVILSSCATILGGRVTECQKTKPLPGKPQREIRVGALLADCVLGFVWLAVDFGTGAIYKPCK